MNNLVANYSIQSRIIFHWKGSFQSHHDITTLLPFFSFNGSGHFVVLNERNGSCLWAGRWIFMGPFGGRVSRSLSTHSGFFLILEVHVSNVELETLKSCSSLSTFSFLPKWKSVQKTCLDFLVSNVNLYSKSRHTIGICVLEERKIWTQLRKSRRI